VLCEQGETNWSLRLWLFSKLFTNEFQIFLIKRLFLFTIPMLSLSLYRSAINVRLKLFLFFVFVDNEALADLRAVKRVSK
jgi:hypothetical protein